MTGFIKQTFIVLVVVLLGVSGSLATKCVSMNNQSCMVRPTLIYVNPDELYYYLFIISLGRHGGRCNTAEDPFCTTFVPNKIEDVSLKVFNMIKGIN